MTDGHPHAAPGVWTPPGVKIFREVVLCAGLAAMGWQMLATLDFPFSRPPPALGLGLLGLSALASERLRLPFQNVVTLALLSGGSGWLTLKLSDPRPGEPRLWLIAVALGCLAGPAARNVAREFLRVALRGQPAGWSLPGLTLGLGILVWFLGEAAWLRSPAPAASGAFTRFPTHSLPVLLLVLLQFALTPWWIDKRRIPVPPDPRSALPWVGAVIASGIVLLARI